MAGSWYRFSLHGQDIQAPLGAEQVKDLEGRGLELEPIAEPEDLAERLAPVVAWLLGPSRLQEIAGWS